MYQIIYLYTSVLANRGSSILRYGYTQKEMVMKDTNMRIKAERKLELERIAIEISFKAGKSIRYTDVINYLIDNFKKDAKEEMINEILSENK